MLTNVVIDDLFEWATAERHWLIDIGSAFDVLIDDPSVELFRRLPHGDPARWRPAFQKPSKAILDRLRRLVPEYGSYPDELLIDLLGIWLGPDGAGLDAPVASFRQSAPWPVRVDAKAECANDWTSELQALAFNGHPQVLDALGWCRKVGYHMEEDPEVVNHMLRLEKAAKVYERVIDLRREIPADLGLNEKGMKLLREAADAGHPQASGNFAFELERSGTGVSVEVQRRYMNAASAPYASPEVRARALLRLGEYAASGNETAEAVRRWRLSERYALRGGAIDLAAKAAWNLAALAANSRLAAALPHFARAVAHGLETTVLAQLCGPSSPAARLLDACLAGDVGLAAVKS
eukprot:gnl/TRDRNA2_/TRDRNA2_127643_c0_seq3.p1 gnl/TRDRNA2_/TRDRNA2_127643_c0~~gnl/TRDRNA2_/TRDRNA2_127643_c0_seq3.p1  ORF type:complete len:350 (+),score=53.50 gnl/TRDRNA2_/TRDRNA2_127643_c0_seq3:182-1231(+)